MLSVHVTIDDVKALILSHNSRLGSRRVLNISLLPLVNMSVKNKTLVFISYRFRVTPPPSENKFVSMTNEIGNMNLDGNHNNGMIQGSSQYQGDSMNGGNCQPQYYLTQGIGGKGGNNARK